MDYRLIAALLLVSAPALAVTYPSAERGHHVDDYHGTKVPDPYRWMEDIDSPATRAWVEAEDKLMTQQFPQTYPAYMQRTRKLIPFIW